MRRSPFSFPNAAKPYILILHSSRCHIVLGKRSRAADSPDLLDLPWLKEVHSKIWNREDLKPKLFRKVVLTYAHYVALQSRLNEHNPDRDKENYNARNHDVRTVKLDFLRSITAAEASSLRHPDDDLDEDDNLDIKLLFPYTLSYLDLSPLELKNRITTRLPSPLLLREEYNYISDLVKSQPQNSGGSLVVSGQPGTGEFLVSLFYTI